MIASRDFVDWDGVLIRAGEEVGEPARMGYSPLRRDWFWNTVKAGKVTSVTVGYPPVERTQGVVR